MEQNNQMSIEENCMKLQAEITRLNQALIEKENFLKEAYQTKLAEIEQKNQMSIEENGVQLQSEISRLSQALAERENFIQEARNAIQEYETKIADVENSKAVLNEKFTQQNDEIRDLRHELCQAEDEKDEAVKTVIDTQNEEFSLLKNANAELEIQLKQLQTTSTNENLSLQQLEIQCNNYAQMIEKLNIEIDVLKSEILGKNDEISLIQNQYSQLGISYQTKLAEMEQNSQMAVEENILQLQSEINRLNELLIAKENFIQEAHSLIQQHLNRANDAENSKAILDEKFSQQNEEISDLKYELCQAEDEKDEAVKSAIDQQKEKFSTLKTTIVELETELKQLQATSTNENIEAIRDKLASQNIELASLRVELKRAEGDKQTANKKAHAEIDMERAQVKRLKDEIRRLSTAQRQNVQNLDSTYVARPPLVEKSTCSNCQNKPQKTPNTVQKPPVYDDEAFMKYDGTGVFATGCGVTKELFLEQAKKKVTKLEEDLSKKKKVRSGNQPLPGYSLKVEKQDFVHPKQNTA